MKTKAATFYAWDYPPRNAYTSGLPSPTTTYTSHKLLDTRESPQKEANDNMNGDQPAIGIF